MIFFIVVLFLTHFTWVVQDPLQEQSVRQSKNILLYDEHNKPFYIALSQISPFAKNLLKIQYHLGNQAFKALENLYSIQRKLPITHQEKAINDLLVKHGFIRYCENIHRFSCNDIADHFIRNRLIKFNSEIRLQIKPQDVSDGLTQGQYVLLCDGSILSRSLWQKAENIYYACINTNADHLSALIYAARAKEALCENFLPLLNQFQALDTANKPIEGLGQAIEAQCNTQGLNTPYFCFKIEN